MDTVSLDALTALEPLPSEEELLARDTLRRFVAEKILPGIGEHFEHNTFPDELIPQIGEIGLLGADRPDLDAFQGIAGGRRAPGHGRAAAERFLHDLVIYVTVARFFLYKISLTTRAAKGEALFSS